MRSDLIDSDEPPGRTDALRRYWSRNLRLIAALTAGWALVTFGIGYFARELDFPVFGWPLSFWVASQGALFVYVALVAYYAWVMNRLDDAVTAELQTVPAAEAAGAAAARPPEPQRVQATTPKSFQVGIGQAAVPES